APEDVLRKVLMADPECEYVAGDKRASNSQYAQSDYPDWIQNIDLLQLPFGDREFDLVICNHVLEHVNNDVGAMTEIRRVLKPDGWAVVQVPYTELSSSTIENDEVARSLDPVSCAQWFGQFDHVRLYAFRDYVRRLQSAGLDVSPKTVDQ